MSRVIAVANQKGGVAKTTSVVSLGAAFARNGLRVLLVDLDAQSSLTFSLGIDPDLVETSIADVLIGESDLAETTLTADEGLRIVPATIDLAGVEAMLLPAEGREFVLRRALEPVLSSYDVILLDCSPSLGLLTLNALAAADEVIVPLQCEMLSHRGVGQLLDTVADVHRLLNPRLIVRGLLPTMYDARSVHSRAVLADVRDRFDLPVLPPIPRSVRFAEAPGVGGSILHTAPTSAGAKAYLSVADTLMRNWRMSSPKPRRSAKKAVTVKAPVETAAAQQVSTGRKSVSPAVTAAAVKPVSTGPVSAKSSARKADSAQPAPPRPSARKAATAKPASTKSKPASPKPASAKSKPASPEPASTKSKPASPKPAPAKSNPASPKPAPTKSKPASPKPTSTKSKPASPRPAPAKSSPRQPVSAKSTPTRSKPVKPASPKPRSTKPAPNTP